MVVYVEYALIDNFAIDYLLLKSTFVLLGKKYSSYRIALCSVLGAGLSLLTPFVESLSGVSIVIKIAIGLLIVLWSNSFSGRKEYALSFLFFMLLTFISGGAVSFIYSLVFKKSSEVSVGLVIIPCYLVIRLSAYVLRSVLRKKSAENLTINVEIFLGEKSEKLVGFIDTGNGLYDGDKPVIIVKKAIGLRLIGENIGILSGKNAKRVRVSTVTGSKELIAFDGKIKIYSGDYENIITNVTVCVSDKFIGSGYDVILHPDLLKIKEIDYDKTVKKVS